jgi:putative transposase
MSRARLRREHDVHVSGKRVLRLMRQEGLLAPQRTHRRRSKRLLEGSSITDAPDMRWGTDGTTAWTVEDGCVWVFDLVDHYTAEAWAHVAKVGDRFAALQPVYDAVIDRHGALAPDVARGLEVWHDWGSRTPGVPQRARMQRLRRTVDQDLEGAMPVDAHLP